MPSRARSLNLPPRSTSVTLPSSRRSRRNGRAPANHDVARHLRRDLVLDLRRSCSRASDRGESRSRSSRRWSTLRSGAWASRLAAARSPRRAAEARSPALALARARRPRRAALAQGLAETPAAPASWFSSSANSRAAWVDEHGRGAFCRRRGHFSRRLGRGRCVRRGRCRSRAVVAIAGVWVASAPRAGRSGALPRTRPRRLRQCIRSDRGEDDGSGGHGRPIYRARPRTVPPAQFLPEFPPRLGQD